MVGYGETLKPRPFPGMIEVVDCLEKYDAAREEDDADLGEKLLRAINELPSMKNLLERIVRRPFVDGETTQYWLGGKDKPIVSFTKRTPFGPLTVGVGSNTEESFTVEFPNLETDKRLGKPSFFRMLNVGEDNKEYKIDDLKVADLSPNARKAVKGLFKFMLR